MKIIKIKKNILEDSKNIIIKNGWNKKLFNEVAKISHYSLNELNFFFPEGYKSLLELYLNEINFQMKLESKKINFLRLKVHQRIKELIIIKLKIMLKEKELIKITFTHLLLPQNHKFSIKSIYKTIDEIWFLAGDNSTDFNFYSKRIILASIYSRVILHFINNDNYNATVDLLNDLLKKVSNIPKIKNRFKDLIQLVPKLFKYKNNISFFKQ